MAFAAACVVAAGGAQAAQADITAYGEPAFTKTNGNNNFYYAWTARDGASSQGDDFRLFHCVKTWQNNVLVENSDGTQGPNSQNCLGLIRGATQRTPSSGTAAYQPFNTGTVLTNGANYQMCADQFYNYFGIWAYDTSNFGHCTNTTIDRDKPVITVGVNGTQEITNNPALALTIDYSDAVSPPWQGAQGYASNWTCFGLNQACQPAGNFDPECSIPANRNAKVQRFTCAASLAQQPDGKWYFCAYSADSAAPDVINWQTTVTSSQANLSGTACGYITVDRAAPAVTANASATTVQAGQNVAFSASATDPNGVDGQYSWTFGDNTSPANGATTNHTYTQPGTYVAKVTTKDVAGNAGEKTVTITVTPASTGGGGGGTTPPPNNGGGGGTTPGGGTTTPGGGTTTPGGGTTTPGGGTTTPGGGTTTPGGGTTTTPGTSQGTSGATPEQTPVSPSTVANMAGGGGTQMSDVGGLEVLAPKSIKAGKAKTLLLALTPDVAGKAQVALVKGSKIVAQKGATFGAAGTYSLKLKLPKKLAAGKYVIRVSFTPTGATKAVTKTIKVRVTAAKKTKKKLAAPSPAKAEGNKIGSGREKPAQRKRAVKIV